MNTWGTWDVRCLNGVMKIPEIAEVRIGLYDTRNKLYKDEFLGESIEQYIQGKESGDTN